MTSTASPRRRRSRANEPQEPQPGDAEAVPSDDELVESLIETFPASDPPSWAALMRVGPPNRKVPRRGSR